MGWKSILILGISLGSQLCWATDHSNLVAHWPLDYRSFNDSSGNAYHLSSQGIARYIPGVKQVDQRHISAAAFNGLNYFVQSDIALGLQLYQNNTFTIAGWFAFEVAESYTQHLQHQALISKWNATTGEREWVLWGRVKNETEYPGQHVNGQIRRLEICFRIHENKQEQAAQVCTTRPVPTDGLIFIAANYQLLNNGSSIKLAGQFDENNHPEWIQKHTSVKIDSYTTPLRIGALGTSYGTTYNLRGSADEVSLWNRQLSDFEISQLAQLNFINSQASPLKTIYTFGDSTTYGFHPDTLFLDRLYDSYPRKLEQLLPVGYKVENYGSRGTRVEQGLQIWKELATHKKPAVVSVLYGVNNIRGCSETPESTFKNLLDLYAAVLATEETKLLALTILPWERDRYGGAWNHFQHISPSGNIRNCANSSSATATDQYNHFIRRFVQDCGQPQCDDSLYPSSVCHNGSWVSDYQFTNAQCSRIHFVDLFEKLKDSRNSIDPFSPFQTPYRYSLSTDLTKSFDIGLFNVFTEQYNSGDGIHPSQSGAIKIAKSLCQTLRPDHDCRALIPLAADWNADGKTDLSYWQPRTGRWYARGVNGNYIVLSHSRFGSSQKGDQPVACDFNADGYADMGLYNSQTGEWSAKSTRNGQLLFSDIQFGSSQELPVVGDFDADSFCDLVLWNPETGLWRAASLANGELRPLFSGLRYGSGRLGDRPVVGDFNGDGRADLGVWRSSTGEWFATTIDQNQHLISIFKNLPFGRGLFSDIPLAGQVSGDSASEILIWREEAETWFAKDWKSQVKTLRHLYYPVSFKGLGYAAP